MEEAVGHMGGVGASLGQMEALRKDVETMGASCGSSVRPVGVLAEQVDGWMGASGR